MRVEDVHPYKKKLNTKSRPLSNEERELVSTYDYILSLFVNFFNYSVEQFDLLTPVQADLILQQREKVQEEHYTFFQDQFRLSNFYAIKTAMADTKKIKQPSDLYRLNFEDEQQPKELKPFVMDDHDKKMLAKLMGKN